MAKTGYGIENPSCWATVAGHMPKGIWVAQATDPRGGLCVY